MKLSPEHAALILQALLSALGATDDEEQRLEKARAGWALAKGVEVEGQEHYLNAFQAIGEMAQRNIDEKAEEAAAYEDYEPDEPFIDEDLAWMRAAENRAEMMAEQNVPYWAM